MFAALVTLDLHIPMAGSLKAKRGVVKAVIARLRQELNCSVAEVDHQNLWQRCRLGVAVASGTHGGALKVAQQVERVAARELRAEIVAVHVQVVSSEDQ